MKNKVQEAFSLSAGRYDMFTSLQRAIAKKIFAGIAGVAAPKTVLDIGCGSGYLTVKIKDHWPQARVAGLDFAQGMLDVARKRRGDIDWLLQDANHVAFDDGCFDLVVSNLVYQWSSDLAASFREARRLLRRDGVFACTLFGFETARELFLSLNEAASRDFNFQRLPHEQDVRQALSAAGFENPRIVIDIQQHEFMDLYALIKWFKSIGANHLKHEGFVGPEVLSRAARIYGQRFSFNDGIRATFEVISVYVKR